jgi:transaldolase
LAELGQSVWLDYLRRALITSAGLKTYVNLGLRGVTSNPAIFYQAIAESDDYDDAMRELSLQGKEAGEIYRALVVEDIQLAADVLKPVYEKTEGEDGYVSLEVSPHLARDRQGTMAAVEELSSAVDRPNVMIKVPATAEGVLAIKDLTAAGYNINVTLMFSESQYDLVSEAYLEGLEVRAANSYALHTIASVASFFVSRVDVKVDKKLQVLGTPEALALRGTIGIANAKMAYQRFKRKFQGDRWDKLAKQGARVQRVLYGSTSTKNPDYPDTLYADNLIGPKTVNTLPPVALEAFLDHGTVAPTLEKELDQAKFRLKELEKLGINLEDVTNQLLDEGIEKFSRPYDNLIESIGEKIAHFITA